MSVEARGQVSQNVNPPMVLGGGRNSFAEPQLKVFLQEGLQRLSREISSSEVAPSYLGIDVDSNGLIIVRFSAFPENGTRSALQSRESAGPTQQLQHPQQQQQPSPQGEDHLKAIKAYMNEISFGYKYVQGGWQSPSAALPGCCFT